MTTTVPHINGEAIREQRVIARFMRYGDGLVAILAVLGMVALPAAFVVVMAALSMMIG